MKITQIKDLVNSSLKEVDGTSVLLKEDLSNVVDVGKDILDKDDIDNFVKKLVDRVVKLFLIVEFTKVQHQVY